MCFQSRQILLLCIAGVTSLCKKQSQLRDSVLNSNVILVLGCLGVAQSLFLSIYLLTLKTSRRSANVFLAIILLGLTIRIGKAVVFEYMYIGPWFRNLGISGFLLVGPAVWFYGRALFDKASGILEHAYMHFVPFVLFVAFSKTIPNDGSPVALFFYATLLFHLGVYLSLSWVLYTHVRATARRGLHSWYLGILIGVTLILMLYVGIFVRVVPLYLLGATAYSFLIYVFSFLFLKKHHFALDKYSQSSVDVSASKDLVLRVKSLFETEAPFLGSDATLLHIARRLNTQPRFLSQAINEVEGVNFSEFVNTYRVAHAKELLKDPDRIYDKIATIAFDCGFGNITSFNVAFKSHVKMTPSEFRKRQGVAKDMN